MTKLHLAFILTAACSGLALQVQHAPPTPALHPAVQPTAAPVPPTVQDGPTIGLGMSEASWLNALAPDELCGTNHRYMAELADLGLNPMEAVCPPIGACDIPGYKDGFLPANLPTFLTVRLSFHVFCMNNGSDCAATQADVEEAVAQLNRDFLYSSIQFTYDTEFINKSVYRNLDVNTGTGMMKMKYVDSPETKLNIYVVNTGGASWGTFPWSQYAQHFYGGIVIDDDWFGLNTPLPTILSHEVGHCLGLWHTFHGVDEVQLCGDCYESAGRSLEEGDQTGDLCRDTEPTPANTNNCFDPEPPMDVDPCAPNGLWMNTPYLNIMGYAHWCPEEFTFTAHQAARMHCWTTEALAGWLDQPAPPAPPNAPGTPTLTKIGGGQVRADWADNSSDESGFQVEREKRIGNQWGETQIIANVAANVTSATDDPGAGRFHYRVRAYNGNGNSDWSSWKVIKN